jgi:sugar phosphate isomerase/epimerase
MKFSCADFTFPLLPHDKVLALIKLLGIDAVDLGIFENRSHHYPSEIAKDPQLAARQMRASLTAAGLEIADVFLQTGEDPPVAAANTPDAAVRSNNRELFKAMVEYTVALGGKHLTGLPGVLHPGGDAEGDWQRMCEEAAWRIEQCRAAGLTYAVEPHVGSITPDPESTLRMLKDVPGLTLTLDYGHFIYQGMSNESVHPLLPHASHFHARGGAKGQLQSTVKDNAIDFPAVMKGLKESGYTGHLCLEYVYVDWEGCNRTDNVAETLQLKELLEKLI